METTGLIFFAFMIALGYLAGRLSLLPTDSEGVFPPLLMNLSYPAMILVSFSDMDLDEVWKSGLFVVLASLLITLFLYWTSAFLVKKMPLQRQAQIRFQLAVGNVVYVSIPLLGVIFGPKILFVAIMHSVAQDLLIWLLYYPLTIRLAEGEKKSNWRQWITSPCLIALLLALFMKAAGLSLPGSLAYVADRLSSMTAPLALFYMGLLLNKYGLWSWLGDRQAMRYALAKTFIIPLLMVPLFFLLPSNRESVILLALLFASPAPIMSIVWTVEYPGDPLFAVHCCVSSTLLYILTAVPAGLLLLRAGLVVH